MKSDPVKPEPSSPISDTPVEPVVKTPEPQFATADEREIPESVKSLEEKAKTLPDDTQVPVLDKTEESSARPENKELEPPSPEEHSLQKEKESEFNRQPIESPAHMEENKKTHESQHTTKMKKSLFRKKEKVIDREKLNNKSSFF